MSARPEGRPSIGPSARAFTPSTRRSSGRVFGPAEGAGLRSGSRAFRPGASIQSSIPTRNPVLRPGFPSVFPSIFHPGFPHVLSSVIWQVLEGDSLGDSSKQFSLGPHPSPQTSLPIGHPLNLPPGFPHVAQLGPLAGPSKQFSSQPERRSSPRPPCPQVSQSHLGVAKPSSIIPSPRPPCSQVPQCHPDVPNNHTISLKPTSNRTSTGPRHGHPAHSYSSGIPACRTITQSLSNRPQTDPRPVLATATLSTGTPVASRRAEQSHNLSQTGL